MIDITQDILDRLRSFQQRADDLRELSQTLSAYAPTAKATDASGYVRLEVGADGLPTDIRIESGWDDAIDPESLGRAVIEAFVAATAARLRTWASSREAASWQTRATELDESPRGTAKPETTTPTDPAIDGPPAQARDLPAMIDDVIAALKAARSTPLAVPVVARGSDGGGHVSLTLARSGLQTCDIDPQWAVEQNERTVTNAVQSALRAARAGLVEQSKPQGDAGGGLVGPALAALRAATELSGRDGSATS